MIDDNEQHQQREADQFFSIGSGGSDALVAARLTSSPSR